MSALSPTGRRIPRVLSIAGTDPTGGAGIHADLKSIGANGVDVFSRYNMSVADEAVEEVGRYNGTLGMGRDDNGVSSVEIGDPFAVCEKVSI